VSLLTYTIAALFTFWHGYIHAMGLYRARLQGRPVGLPLLLSLPVLAVTQKWPQLSNRVTHGNPNKL
jgi:hypothetical protein